MIAYVSHAWKGLARSPAIVCKSNTPVKPNGYPIKSCALRSALFNNQSEYNIGSLGPLPSFQGQPWTAFASPRTIASEQHRADRPPIAISHLASTNLSWRLFRKGTVLLEVYVCPKELPESSDRRLESCYQALGTPCATYGMGSNGCYD